MKRLYFFHEISGSKLRVIFYVMFSVCILTIGGAMLWQWHALPIYPDEIAYRLIGARAWRDGPFQRSLFILCNGDYQRISWLYRPAAWLFSQYDRFVAPHEVRNGVMLISGGVLPAALWLGWSRRHIVSAVAILGGFIGTTGAVLVMARPEILLLLNVALVMVALAVPERGRKAYVLPLALGVWGSFYLSSYVHLQGLILFPLTFYALLFLASEWLSFPMAFLAASAVVAPLVPFGVMLHHGACTGYPGISALRDSLAFHFADLQREGGGSFAVNKVRLLIENISYMSGGVRRVPYVPNVNMKGADFFLRNSDNFILYSVFLIVVSSLLFSLYGVMRVLFSAARGGGRRSIADTLLSNRLSISAVLLTFPVYALWVYDAQNAFYRSAVFMALLSCAMVMGLADLKGHWRLLSWPVAALFLLTAGACYRANASLFVPAIAEYEQGGSLSLFHDWQAVSGDIAALSRETVPPLNAGGLVIDDLTYSALRNRPNLTPITYLGLQILLTHLSAWSIVDGQRLNGVIARCSLMETWHIPTPHRRGEICAVSREEWRDTLSGLHKGGKDAP